MTAPGARFQAFPARRLDDLAGGRLLTKTAS
jgi:hypothetical protein